jgi:hypothetical protein
MTQQTGQPLLRKGPLAEREDLKTLNMRLGALSEEILKASGRFLYSSIYTLCKGDFYLLGGQPGGKPSDYSALKAEIDCWQYKTEDWSAYYETDWSRNSKLQTGVEVLCDAICTKPHCLCASNLIFTRSQNQDELSEDDARPFLPIHGEVLSLVKPHCIITLGNLPFESLSKMPSLILGPVKTHPAGHDNWQCRIAQGHLFGNDVKLIGLPDLSCYSIKHYPDVLKWVKAQCAR